MTLILSNDIRLIDLVDMIFTYAGKEYYLPLSGSELKKEIAYDLGDIEEEYIDVTVYEGSPYRTRRRAATSDDVTTDHIENWISNNRHMWKTYENDM